MAPLYSSSDAALTVLFTLRCVNPTTCLTKLEYYCSSRENLIKASHINSFSTHVVLSAAFPVPKARCFYFKFKEFSIIFRSRKVCDNDYLEIHHNGLAETVCGHQTAKKAVINGNSFTLVFHSGNVKLGGTGFIMTYITRDVMRGQWKKITKIKQGLSRLSESDEMRNFEIPEMHALNVESPFTQQFISAAKFF